MDKLQELANTGRAKDVYYSWIGTTYEQLKQFSKATSYYQQAATHAESDGGKAQYVALAARALHAAGDVNAATAMLEDAIANMTDEGALAALYKGLANTYEIEDNQFLRAIAIEKAITYEPNASYLMFNAGYAYSEVSFRDLAILHYTNLLQIRPKDDTALNNLGVEFTRDDMPLKSVAAYKQAATEGNTLAMSNLAFKLIDAGFQKEALALLDEAAKQKAIDENVPHARSRLELDKQKEDKAEQDILRRGKVSQSFLRCFAEAYFSKRDNVTIAGDWYFSSVGDISIEQDREAVKASWQRGDQKYTLNGAVHNRGVRGAIKKELNVYSSSTESLEMYVSDDMQKAVMLKNNEVLTGTRIVRPALEEKN